MQKPRVDPGDAGNSFHGPTGQQSVAQTEDAFGCGDADFILQRFLVERAIGFERRGILTVGPESGAARFEGPQRFLHRLFEGAPDSHSLAHALHLGGQDRVGLREFFESETRNLDHAIIDGGLEAGRRFPRNIVAQFVERVADSQFGGDFGDGEPGGLGCQGGRARDARVHFDDHHASGLRTDRELDVRTSCFDANGTDDRKRGVAHGLVFLVGQRLDRCDRDGVAGMHSHGIEILDGANDNAVVGVVAHHLDLELFPAEQGLFDEHFPHR